MGDAPRDTEGDGGEPVADEASGSPFPDFASAARAVLEDLHRQFGLRLWLVTRTVGDHQVVLEAQDAPQGYGVVPGTVLSWGGSLCAAMIAGRGPHIAPRVTDVPAYAGATNRQHAVVEAYVGVPLVRSDGEVFGTLCAFDPEPQPHMLERAEETVLLQGRLLSTVLSLELGLERLARRAERAETDATTDALTGVGNRRGWQQVMAAEESRCRRYGHPASVVVVDLNDLKGANDRAGHAAGDDALRACARALVSAARSSDYVARVGGDEFALLAVETGPAGGHADARRIQDRLVVAGISAAVGVGSRAPDGTLDAAWRDADAAMYRHKSSRSASRDAPPVY